MPVFDALVFDGGGTLYHFEGDWPAVYRQANAELAASLRASGLELDENSFLEQFSARLEAYHAERDSEFIEYTTAYVLHTLLAEHGYPDVPDEVIASSLKAMYRVSQAHWHAEADAAPTLEALRASGYRLGLLSNAADDADVQSLVDKSRLRPFFDRVLTSAEAGIRKPHPHIFRKMLAVWDFPPERVAMIGDTLGADILGAQNIGMFAIWITRRADTAANRAHADTISPDASIGTLSELPSLLTDLANAD